MEEEKDTILHSWEITAHEERERSRGFYFWFFVATIALVSFAIWQESFLFGIFILLAAGTILFLSGQRAEVYRFTFTDTHFIIGDSESEYPYGAVSHFDLHQFSETDRELLIIFREHLRPLLRVRYYKGDEEKIEDIFASKQIPRKTIEPSILDIFSKIVGI